MILTPIGTQLNFDPAMLRALELAERGRGFVEPNPMVGAVVLDVSGAVVGEGWHERFGGPHAEVNAFAMAGERAKGGTLVVTLEPCSHFGKTPPCVDAVIRSGVKRVVVAMRDPFPEVSGRGIQKLRDSGIEVQVGLLEAEARTLNAPYLKLLATGMPWVIAKWAMSLDGKIATHTGESKWISSEASRKRVHELRGRVDAILVGSGTVHADDPLLTARPAGARIAARVVLSRSGNLPAKCRLLDSIFEAPVLVFTSTEGQTKLKNWSDAGAEVIPITELPGILKEFGRRRFTNILVEGGAGVLGELLEAKAIDEVHAYLAPKLIGGVSALGPIGGNGITKLSEAMEFDDVKCEMIGGDVLVIAKKGEPTP